MQESRTRSGPRLPAPRARGSAAPDGDPDVEPTVELRVDSPDQAPAPSVSSVPSADLVQSDEGTPDAEQPSWEEAQAEVASTPADIESAVQRAHLALGFDQAGGLEERTVSLVLEIDEKGVQRTLTQRTLWRATGAGADSFPVFALLPTPVGERVTVEGLEGCATGPTYADLREGLFATALLLERRLAAGEEAVTVHRITLPGDGVPQNAYEHSLKQWVDDVTVEIRFHPELLPSGIAAHVRVADDEEAVAVTTTETAARASCGGFGPGVAGVRWQW